MREHFSRWRANFFAGLVVVLPTVVTIAIVRWLFGTVSNVTDLLLFFLPRTLTHIEDGRGPMRWYWSLLALLLGALLVTLVGRAARNYVGRRIIRAVDRLMSRVPLLNKIYTAVKEVNDAFSTSKKSTFKQVVLVEYPRQGIHTIGFVTSDQHPEASARLGQPMVGVFIPTTPNPTSGFLIVVARDQVTKMDMSVAEGIKYVISLGALVPDLSSRDACGAVQLPAAAAGARDAC
jgi:uncharacterized membrane protein